MASSTYQSIYRVVRCIPRGRVATYGQVAALAGRDRQARLVGYALAALEDLSDVPWHRVVNARGEISRRQTQSGAEQEQYLRLVSEGVVFSPDGRISLARCQWRSGASG